MSESIVLDSTAQQQLHELLLNPYLRRIAAHVSQWALDNPSLSFDSIPPETAALLYYAALRNPSTTPPPSDILTAEEVDVLLKATTRTPEKVGEGVTKKKRVTGRERTLDVPPDTHNGVGGGARVDGNSPNFGARVAQKLCTAILEDAPPSLSVFPFPSPGYSHTHAERITASAAAAPELVRGPATTDPTPSSSPAAGRTEACSEATESDKTQTAGMVHQNHSANETSRKRARSTEPVGEGLFPLLPAPPSSYHISELLRCGLLPTPLTSTTSPRPPQQEDLENREKAPCRTESSTGDGHPPACDGASSPKSMNPLSSNPHVSLIWASAALPAFLRYYDYVQQNDPDRPTMLRMQAQQNQLCWIRSLRDNIPQQ